ncbi:alpha/beta hydrolase [Clostridium fungisolvens]|uniref:Monoterpene epsilon-lactone hydrolase n=1 Tax=Clostridium fungisolvens TaxID=1604897 RepID=A0A6V8SHT4_9CLOT|nr:alpha/beta hydrolase [Clostridium fungisolvens]GFP74688.1 Monoterpene epsilon-lactone hydrolase [Clostridium fungisolvens]
MASLRMKFFIKMLMKTKEIYDPNFPKDYRGQRDKNDARAAKLKIKKDISIEQYKVNEIPIEILSPQKTLNDNIIYYIHGGGFNNGSLISARPFAAELAHNLNTKVISIQYKLAPEYKYPTQLEECMTIYKWIKDGIAKNSKIIILGDSAGGNLALALTHYIIDEKMRKPEAICVISPPTDFSGNLASRKEKEKVDCIISRNFDLEIRNTYIGTADLNNPYISPINGSFVDFPPLRIDVGTEEMLLDDSLLLEKKVKSAGGYVETHVWDGLCHVFPLFPIPEKKKYYSELKAFIRRFS